LSSRETILVLRVHQSRTFDIQTLLSYNHLHSKHCKVEPQAGPCRAAFQHWYYNSRTGNCEPFIYGGCRGNKNNYISKENC
uniref:BPTI/Kunitz inhibitor domain-containing protein n=1 Tax=Seriola lalandi dorsalis TaxID=1841481 RepID=A0A3B4X2Z2_SERLL